MLTTEDEAKTKRCQESFGDGFVGSGTAQAMSIPANPFGYGSSAGALVTSSPAMCIGSACMAWRWRGWVDPQRADGHVYEHGDRRATSHVGYCGKAGRP